MKKIVLFSGTTEGRTLSNLLSQERIHHVVCVASDYGKDMMDEDPYAQVHVGRMDKDEMTSFMEWLSEGEKVTVIDATHPYATEVTENIKYAAGENGFEYIRIIREEISVPSGNVKRYGDIKECAASVDTLEGNILLTTGSKELGEYCGNVSEETKARTYVRILPAIESLKICEENGIEPRHIIAMHGPFSEEMNEALIRQYDIKHLITKDSGTNGGFAEKLGAAEKCGAQLHVISRPVKEEGISVEAAYRMITGKETEKAPKEMSISLIGLGMGDADCMTVAAKSAIAESDILFGASRLAGSVSHPHKYEMYKAADIIAVLEKEQPKKAAVLFSGDTGFYSGAKALYASLKEWRKDISLNVIPGISSFSYLSARLGENYDDAALFSLHGKNTDKDLTALADKVRHNAKTFVLLSGAGDVAKAAERLLQAGIKGRIYIGTDLSYEDEKIKELSVEEAAGYEGEGIVTMLVCNEKPVSGLSGGFKKDEDFLRAGIPMTKECIRHESIIRLEIKEGDVFYDIGGGTGSVAIEAASLYPGISVVTIEKNKEAVELIRENIDRAACDNVRLIEGTAPEALEELEKPDCVFIGGSGGELASIMDTLHKKGSGIRFVINAISLETIEEVKSILKEYEVENERIIMMSVSEAKKAGAYHLMTAQNPVWIFSFVL